MSQNRYWDEWDENSSIAWRNAGRKKLNVVIRLVNQWGLDDCPPEDVPLILRHIDMGLQTYGADEGGSGWEETLREMEEYVKERSRRED